MVLILILLLTELFIISNVAQGNFYLYCIGVFNYIISLAPPSTGLYFNLSGTIYLPGDTIPITDVGDGFLPGYSYNQVDPGPSLVCVTSNVNTMCCRGGDHPGSGAVGNWLYSNGTIVLGNSANPNGDFTRSSHYQQIRLNRKRNDVMSPTGVYTCEVPDESNTAMLHKANITLGEYNYYRYCDHRMKSPNFHHAWS